MPKFKISKKVKSRYLTSNKSYGVILLFLILFCNVPVLQGAQSGRNQQSIELHFLYIYMIRFTEFKCSINL